MDEVRSKSQMQLWINNTQADQYMIFSECMKISDETLVVVSIEKLKQDGFLIKMHDLNELASDEFYLVKKTNNTYIRLNRSAGADLIIKEELRSLIFDLAFAVSIPST